MIDIMHSSGDLLPRQAAAASADTPSDSRAPHILAIIGSLTGLSGLLVALRCYVRLFLLRKFLPDDGVIVVSLLCAFGVLACFVGESHHGVGLFSDDIKPEDFQVLSEYMFYHAIVIVLGISLVKVSLALFLLRFASPNKNLKRFIVGALGFLIVFTIACIMTLIFQCLPVRAAWDFSLRQNARCYSMKTYLAIGEFNSAINIATDFVFATLPAFMFYKVQVNKRTRVSLMGILSLGYFACAAGIVKTVLQSQIFDEPDPYRDCQYLIWNCIELNVGIIAASFPTIKPLVKSVIGTTLSFTSGVRSGKRNGQGYHVRSSYIMHSLQQSRTVNEDQKYSVQIGTLDGSDRGSEENLTQRPRRGSLSRIIQTTEVIVHSEESADLRVMRIGPARTVDDRV
ncbi:hypothetical protein ABOM_002388 [Aspergillus bombycis]|uniref:Rhodopsin domain-containing protein n=1 Tax=Aspergillus bombycis TaxID=109264 RepID=A0A1F8A9V5_9EURO|nr:hypothetical protein ABOM_002388 [Aspergillus bombycis]OGM48473.1 hypothetical protein ABOM_002388 [Aspergillus bombycis]